MTDDNSIINGLIATTLDSAYGYDEAARDAKNNEFRSMFTQRAQERRTVVQQLRQLVTSAGGTPEDDGTILGQMHRSWTGLRASLSRDDSSVIAEVERGEDHIKAKFESALQNRDLSPEARNVVQQCFTSIRRGHDQASQLKHSHAA